MARAAAAQPVAPYALLTRWRLAPLLAPAFASNHHAVMQEGGRELARHLDAHLIDFTALDRGTQE